jgi:hypothetical protein
MKRSIMKPLPFVLCLLVLLAIFAPIFYFGWQILGVTQ